MQDIKVRKNQAWEALHKLNSIWKSNCSTALKRETFTALVESILLYGCTSWTLTKSQQKNLDGTYTNMLCKVMNVTWKAKIRNEDLYGPLPKVSEKVRAQRLQHNGHCYRHRKEEVARDVLLWVPSHGSWKVGRPQHNYVIRHCSKTMAKKLRFYQTSWTTEGSGRRLLHPSETSRNELKTEVNVYISSQLP